MFFVWVCDKQMSPFEDIQVEIDCVDSKATLGIKKVQYKDLALKFLPSVNYLILFVNIFKVISKR